MKNRNTDLWIESQNDRRRFLKLAGYGTLGLMTGGFLPFFNHSASAQNQNTSSEAGFLPDLDISIVSQPGELAVFPGESTRVWRYRAIVNKGDKNRVTELPRSYLGPIIKVHQGEKIKKSNP